MISEIDYWQRVESSDIKPLPKDSSTTENRVKESENRRIYLSEKETEKLLTKVNKVYDADINDILLTALGLAIKKWTGENKVVINLEGHGREDIIENVDVSRTIGWFTSLYPVILNLSDSEDLTDQIRKLRKTLQEIPNKGVGYGILKYLTSDENKKALNFNLQPEICFNYLGQFDQDINMDVFSISELETGTQINPESERCYVLDINGIVIDDKLTINFNWNKNEFKEENIDSLMEGYKQELKGILNNC